MECHWLLNQEKKQCQQFEESVDLFTIFTTGFFR
jgi:hypothetical protein